MLPKRSVRRYVTMAISTYQTASWLTRIILFTLLCTVAARLFYVFSTSDPVVITSNAQELNIAPDNSQQVIPAADAQLAVRDATLNVSDADVMMAGQLPLTSAGDSAGLPLSPLSDKPQFGRPLEGGEKRLPDCLIIGARKGGTRALITFLAMHPTLVTTGDEVQFFNNNESYAKGYEWYLDQLPTARPDQVLIEKTAEYFHVLWVPERVKLMNPDIKILLVVRDPFIRMVSDYNFLRRFAANNEVAGYEFPELKYTVEELAVNNVTGVVNTGYGGLHRSKYYKFLGNWLRHFPREQIHIINGDRLAADNPAIELKQVESFLGIESYFTEDFFYKDEEKGFYCITATGCLGKEKGHKQPEFDPEFIRKIRIFLRPLNLLFYNMAGYDFGWE